MAAAVLVEFEAQGSVFGDITKEELHFLREAAKIDRRGDRDSFRNFEVTGRAGIVLLDEIELHKAALQIHRLLELDVGRHLEAAGDLDNLGRVGRGDFASVLFQEAGEFDLIDQEAIKLVPGGLDRIERDSQDNIVVAAVWLAGCVIIQDRPQRAVRQVGENGARAVIVLKHFDVIGK